MSAVTVIHESGEKRMLFALTVDQYHQMIQDGILPEGDPFELIYGQVTHKQRHAAGTDPMTTGHEHAWV